MQMERKTPSTRISTTIHTSRRQRWALLLIACATVPLMLYAETLTGLSTLNTKTGMYEFKAGTVIDPNEVNHNFDQLATLINTPDYVSAISVATDGKVGIGTKLPGAKLDVYGQVLSAGNAANPNFAFNGNANTGMFQPVSNMIGFSTGGTERMRIDNAGNVGIGAASPVARLDLYGAVAGSSKGDTSLLASFGHVDSNAEWMRFLTYRTDSISSHTTLEQRIQRRVDASDMGYVGFGSNYLALAGNGAENVRIDSSGNVGIGTTKPLAKLHISGMGETDATALRIDGSSVYSRDILFSEYGDTAFGGIIRYDSDEDQLQLLTLEKASEIPGISIARTTGFVGIGTVEPETSLDVAAHATIRGSVVIASSGVGSGYPAGNFWHQYQDSNGDFHLARNGWDPVIKIQRSDRTVIFNTSSSMADLIVASNGNVGIGIGTTSPAYKLEVNGTIHASGGVSVVGEVISDDYLYNSDARLKADILPLEDASEGIACLEGVSYRWSDSGASQDRQIGLIAQDVERCFPEVVTTDSKGYKSVSYARLVAPLIENAKEQQRVAATQQRLLLAQQQALSAQQREIAAMKAQLERIEALVKSSR